MAAHRYWRMRFPSSFASDGVLISMSELEMRVSAGGADQTTGKTAFASDFYNTDTPSNMIDGVINTTASIWSTFTKAAPTGGHWIAVDFGLGGDVDIVEFTLRSTIYGENPREIIFEWSDDSTTWTNVGSTAISSNWSSNETRTYNISPPVNIRLSQSGVEVARTGTPDIRLSQSGVEVARTGTPDIRLSQSGVEVAYVITSVVARRRLMTVCN